MINLTKIDQTNVIHLSIFDNLMKFIQSGHRKAYVLFVYNRICSLWYYSLRRSTRWVPACMCWLHVCIIIYPLFVYHFLYITHVYWHHFALTHIGFICTYNNYIYEYVISNVVDEIIPVFRFRFGAYKRYKNLMRPACLNAGHWRRWEIRPLQFLCTEIELARQAFNVYHEKFSNNCILWFKQSNQS